MSTTNRLNVVPTVTVLAVIKNRLAGAQKGYKLLKKKADALKVRQEEAAEAGHDDAFGWWMPGSGGALRASHWTESWIASGWEW